MSTKDVVDLITHTARRRCVHEAIFLGSGTEGFGSLIRRAKPAIIETGVLRVAGWLVGCLFFSVDVIDGAQQCGVLQAISGDIDGIIHRHSSCAGFKCWFFLFFSGYV